MDERRTAAFGITGAVDALVALVDGEEGAFGDVGDFFDKVKGMDGVAIDFEAFQGLERAGLEEDFVGDADHADVVEEGAHAKAAHLFFGVVEVGADGEGVEADIDQVIGAGVFVEAFLLDHGGEFEEEVGVLGEAGQDGVDDAGDVAGDFVGIAQGGEEVAGLRTGRGAEVGYFLAGLGGALDHAGEFEEEGRFVGLGEFVGLGGDAFVDDVGGLAGELEIVDVEFAEGFGGGDVDVGDVAAAEGVAVLFVEDLVAGEEDDRFVVADILGEWTIDFEGVDTERAEPGAFFEASDVGGVGGGVEMGDVGGLQGGDLLRRDFLAGSEKKGAGAMVERRLPRWYWV